MSFFRARWRGAINVTIVDDEIEWLDRRIRRISAMHGLAFVADDHVFHETPHDVIENRDAEE